MATTAEPTLQLTDDVNKLREEVQKAVVEVITSGLQEGKISEDRAKIMAKSVLDKLPETLTYEQFMEILPKLDDNYPELSRVVVPLMEQYLNKEKAQYNEKIKGLLAQGKIDDALNLTNEAIGKEKNLS
jgi:uncharacterized membrane-anchored protein YjiN (DUF445 family)